MGDFIALVPDFLAAFSGECGRNEWNMGGAIMGDREGMEEEKERDRHSTYLRYPPTF